MLGHLDHEVDALFILDLDDLSLHSLQLSGLWFSELLEDGVDQILVFLLVVCPELVEQVGEGEGCKRCHSKQELLMLGNFLEHIYLYLYYFASFFTLVRFDNLSLQVKKNGLSRGGNGGMASSFFELLRFRRVLPDAFEAAGTLELLEVVDVELAILLLFPEYNIKCDETYFFVRSSSYF